MRFYYHFVCGAIGGVSGWYMCVLLREPSPAIPTVGKAILQGGILGGLIGLGSCIFDGLAAGSIARTVRFGGAGMLLGLLAGAVTLPLTQAVSTVIAANSNSSSLLRDVLGWALFGGTTCLAAVFSGRPLTWRAVLQTLAGGAASGGLSALIQFGNFLGDQVTPALAFVLLGGTVGAVAASVSVVLNDAWLLVENGKLRGHSLSISKYVHKDLGSRNLGIIGSQWGSQIYLPGDPAVMHRHASIGYVGGTPVLTPLSEATLRAVTKVNGRPVYASWPIRDGDRIEIGSTLLRYHQKV